MAAAPGSDKGGLRPPDPILNGPGGTVNMMMNYLGTLGTPNIHVTPSSSVPTLISDRPLQIQRQTESTNNLTIPMERQNMS